MILLIYRLDKIIGSNDSMVLSHDALKRIQGLIKDYCSKINSVKQHMKESIALLNDIQLDLIEKIIATQGSNEESNFVCDKCSKSYKSKAWLDKHKCSS